MHVASGAGLHSGAQTITVPITKKPGNARTPTTKHAAQYAAQPKTQPHATSPATRNAKEGDAAPMAKDTRPYFTVTNELFRHPKWTALPNDKIRLHLLELWGHCNEFRTDGIVAKHVLHSKGAAVAKALIAGGWVNATPDPQTFEMHDYLNHQPSRAEIEERIADKRSAGAEGGKRSAHTRWHTNRGVIDPKCDYCKTAVSG